MLRFLRFRSNGNNALQQSVTDWKKLTWKANDADEPMSVLIDRHHDKVLVEQVDLLGPLPHPIVALLCRREAGIVLDWVVLVRLVLARGPGGKALVEVGGEDVGLGQDRLLVLVFAVLQVPKQHNKHEQKQGI